MVLFMPYLHWETDRGRLQSARCVKAANVHKQLSMDEVVNQAQHGLSQTPTSEPGNSSHGDGNVSVSIEERRTPRRVLLSRLLLRAALLLEAMESHTEEQLMYRYLHEHPPLHPRRTLDQSYYGALKSTVTRDRDQVVYRGTRPQQHDCVGFDKCAQCNEDVKKVPRLIMVDQLWLWILDERK